MKQWAQKGCPLLAVRRVGGLPDAAGVLVQRNPDQVAASQVSTLSTCFAALTFLRPGELLVAATKLFRLPAHLPGIEDHFTGQVRGQMGAGTVARRAQQLVDRCRLSQQRKVVLPNGSAECVSPIIDKAIQQP